MSRLAALLNELCPDGVEYKPLSELLSILDSQRQPVRKSDRISGPYPYYGANGIQDYVDDFLFEGSFILLGEDGSVLTEDNRPVTNWAEGKIWVNNHAHVLTQRNAFFDLRFAYYALTATDIRLFVSGGSRVKLNQAGLRAIPLPVPPLEVQQEIVRVLDAFTDLEQSLVAELELRKKQYDFYRCQLLSETNESGTQVPLGDLGRIVTGRTPKSNDTRAWGFDVDFVTPSDIRDGMKEVTAPKRQLSQAGSETLARSLIPAGSILVTCIGADMGKTVINANDCVTNQQINSVILNPGINPDYVFHFLTAMRPQLLAQGSRSSGTMPILNKTDFSRIQISMPSLDEQNRIAQKLNKFDSLIFNSDSGIAAEIALRRTQYEVYCDELLSFAPKEI